ncbi:MAG: cation:proton antiporter [Bacteroidota bacterium]|nr:cation:proton antiporter [Bacteroidota bacterium]
MELSILIDIVIIFAFSTAVNYLFTRIKIPTIIGYLLTGIVVGPSLFGIIRSPHDIEFMAELGVIILMFTIGLEFSLNHLIKIRKIVFFWRVCPIVIYCRYYRGCFTDVRPELGGRLVCWFSYRTEQYRPGA